MCALVSDAVWRANVWQWKAVDVMAATDVLGLAAAAAAAAAAGLRITGRIHVQAQGPLQPAAHSLPASSVHRQSLLRVRWTSVRRAQVPDRLRLEPEAVHVRQGTVYHPVISCADVNLMRCCYLKFTDRGVNPYGTGGHVPPIFGLGGT